MKVRGQEVKIIKEYEKFILVEFPAGYRECIDKFEINKVKNKRKIKEPILRGITGLKV